MHYGVFEEEIIKTTPTDQIVALDLEIHPHVKKPEDILLPSRQIIGIGVMYFTDDKPTLFVAEDEGTEYELAILRDLDGFIKSQRPLLVVGYGISSFDRPFLTLKMKTQYRTEKLWAINDMIERALETAVKLAEDKKRSLPVIINASIGSYDHRLLAFIVPIPRQYFLNGFHRPNET